MVTNRTRSMMAMLPSQMKMAKDEGSVGAQFLDVFGVELDDVATYLEESWNNMYVGTANLQTADFAYRIPLALRDVVDISNIETHVQFIIEGERTDCLPVLTLREFFSAVDSVYMIDTIEGFVYVRPSEYYMEENIFRPFDAISIGGTMHFEYELHHIWNLFDEFGLLLNIRRLPGERNESFKNRLIDVFQNPGGSHEQGLMNALSRELAIPQSDISLGALSDDVWVNNNLINSEGLPTQKYIEIVDQINRHLGFAWDSMNWGEAYWRSVEENNLGFYYLPHIWDGFSAEWKDGEIQSGIGDGDDLLVIAPKQEPSTRNFRAFVGLRGTDERNEEQFPEIHFSYRIVARGKIPNDQFPLEDYRYTVVGSEIINLHYSVIALRNFMYQTRLDFEGRYAPIFENQQNPGIEIVTGETVLHNPTDPRVRLRVDMHTTDRTQSPRLEELTVEWVDTSDNTHQFVLSSDEDFTQNSTAVQTEFIDTEVDVRTGNHALTLGKGSFSAIIDTEGSWRRGAAGVSVRINREGSISLDLPTIP